jgi:hypothetical protein
VMVAFIDIYSPVKKTPCFNAKAPQGAFSILGLVAGLIGNSNFSVICINFYNHRITSLA